MSVKKRAARPKLVLNEFQLQFLRTGRTEDTDAETFLDWCGGRGGDRIRRAFLSVRDDYPRNFFPWAEKEFGGKR